MPEKLLKDVQVKNAKPRKKPHRLNDGGGLCLLISPEGGKWWRFRYRFEGRAKMLSLGTYPKFSLDIARRLRDYAREKLAHGVDPSQAKQEKKQAVVQQAIHEGNTLEAVGREWFEKFSPSWAGTHADRLIRRLERDVFPWLGGRPVVDITGPEFLAVLRRVEDRGALETAHRIRQTVGQIIRYAIATHRAERDITADLRGALPPSKATHFASITDPKAIGQLLRDIDGYQGGLVVKSALRLAPLVFVRPGELRRAEWAEIRWEDAEWRLPAEKMKCRVEHIVPLSRQSLEVLGTIRPLTGGGRFIFPSDRSPNGDRPMSENTVLVALRALGYGKDQMTGHGFRSMASTRLNEMGFHRDCIERQLAHGERDSVRAAYNFAEHLKERRAMMQKWADYLDGLKAGAVVLPFAAKAG